MCPRCQRPRWHGVRVVNYCQLPSACVVNDPANIVLAYCIVNDYADTLSCSQRLRRQSREYLHENVFACSYRAQVEFLIKMCLKYRDTVPLRLLDKSIFHVGESYTILFVFIF